MFKLAEKSFSRCYCSWSCQEYSQAKTNIWKLFTQATRATMAATTALKHCRNAVSALVSPVCFEFFRFLVMPANPKLTFDSTLYQLATQV